MPASVLVPCEIRRGGFSGERVVSIACTDGSVKKSLVPTQYCWKADGKTPLDANEPPNGDSIDGRVIARLLEITPNNELVIDLPDGEVMLISKENVRPWHSEIDDDVLVRS